MFAYRGPFEKVLARGRWGHRFFERQLRLHQFDARRPAIDLARSLFGVEIVVQIHFWGAL